MESGTAADSCTVAVGLKRYGHLCTTTAAGASESGKTGGTAFRAKSGKG